MASKINKGNYIRVDTDFIFTTIKVNLDVNYRQFKKEFCFCSNEMQQCRIWRAKQNEDLKNDNIAIDPEKVQPSTQSAIQSVKNDNELSPKCKNCTLEELAVLRIMQQNPSVTQKQIAALIGKSERTVKTLTIHMTEKGIIIRRNGKRNGYWEILSE